MHANEASLLFFPTLLYSCAHTALPLSVRKLKEVYQDNKRELSIQVGLELYRSAAAAAAGAAAAAATSLPFAGAQHAHAALDDALSRSEDELDLPSTSHLQLALLPTQTGSLVPLPVRGQRAPMAHLLALVPAKRKATGVCCCLPVACKPLLTAAHWFVGLQPLPPAQARASRAVRARTRAWRAARTSRLRSCSS
jgi:hypothetical protein